MESAGDTVAVQALKPVFRWCMGVFGGLCFADMMLYVFGLTGGVTQRAVFAATAVYLVIGAFLGWFVAEMLIRRSFRVFRGGWRGFGGWAVCCAVLLAALTATELDVLGLERRQPEAEQLEGVSVIASNAVAYLDAPEGVEQALALHRGIIDHKSLQDQCDQKAYFLRGMSGDVQTVYVQINYFLKNGSVRSRSYTLAHRYDTSGDAAAALQALLNCPNAVQNRKEIPFDFTAENVSYGTVSAVMPAAECAAAAGYDDPETYVLCELGGYSRAEADALSGVLREEMLREMLQGWRYYGDELYLSSNGYLEKYDIDTDQFPEKNGALDWDRIWLEYSLPLTEREAWELYSTCVAPDLAANALGRVWILPGSDYDATVYSASVEIDARWPETEDRSAGREYNARTGEPIMPATEPYRVSYYGFSTVPTVDSARTNAWLEARGIRLYTVGEIRAAKAR